jgi:hypothetical protein
MTESETIRRGRNSKLFDVLQRIIGYDSLMEAKSLTITYSNANADGRVLNVRIKTVNLFIDKYNGTRRRQPIACIDLEPFAIRYPDNQGSQQMSHVTCILYMRPAPQKPFVWCLKAERQTFDVTFDIAH